MNSYVFLKLRLLVWDILKVKVRDVDLRGMDYALE